MLKNVRFETANNILVASLTGELDHHNASQLRMEIDAATRAFRTKHLVLDYTQVEFMDSSGIGLAMGRYRSIKERKGIMVIVPGNSYVSRLLGLSGIFALIPKCQSRYLAVSFINEKGGKE